MFGKYIEMALQAATCTIYYVEMNNIKMKMKEIRTINHIYKWNKKEISSTKYMVNRSDFGMYINLVPNYYGYSWYDIVFITSPNYFYPRKSVTPEK